ncbi:MAG: substrate-binding domain-containing protein, partial [Clostridia bacterium]
LLLIVIMTMSFFAFTACGKTPAPESQKVVRISTTTSVNDSGLMAYLEPYFKADTGYVWEIASAGTGAAIASATYGNADVILVHSKSSEEKFVTDGYASKVAGYNNERVSFMYNFFVLVGPKADPAKTNDAATVKDAFANIASTNSPFISRGDKSGTHNKEWTLWPKTVGITSNDVSKIPSAILNNDKNPTGWYYSAGQGMGACLTMANEKSAYCLTDKATFLSFANDKAGNKLPNLEIVYEADKDLKNTYSMIAVNPNAKFLSSVDKTELPAGTVKIDAAAAKVFMDWMTSEHAKALISFYGETKYGGSLFSLMNGYLAA